MPSAEDVLRVARGEVGATSGKKYWDAYFGGAWAYVSGYSTPWCACFVTWVLNKAGVRCPAFPSACAFDERDDLGGRKVGRYSLKPGDVVAFDWDGDRGGDHVGIVCEVLGDGHYRTIEGNTGSGVCAYCERWASSIVCGVRPYYSDAAPTDRLDVDGWAGTDTIRAWQVQMGTSADGWISGQLAENDRCRPNVLNVGHGTEGSLLVMAVQRKAGCYADGHWGPDTSRAIQRRLERWGYYRGGVDGVFGHHSVVALQQSLNDGKWK